MATCLTYVSIPLAAELLAAITVWGLVPLVVAPAAATSAALRVVGALVAHATLATYASPARGQLRRQEGIPGSGAADWALWCLLPGCMLCQEAAQLAARQQLRKAAAGGNGSGVRAAVVEPPQQQFMQSVQPVAHMPGTRDGTQGGQAKWAQRAQQLASVAGRRNNGYAALPTVEPLSPLAALPPAQQLISVRA